MREVEPTLPGNDDSMFPCAPAVKIVADDCERPSGIPDLLRSHREVQVSIERLAVGDYLIDDRVIVERKTLDDFARSVIDTRLFTQASRLNRCSFRSAFLIQGRELKTAMPQHALNGALISLALVFDIPVLRSEDAVESARILGYCARQLAETRLRGVTHTRWKPRRAVSQRLHVLSSLPGIGEKRARLLLEHFGTVEACMCADEEALCAVSGIGAKRARDVRRVVAESAVNGETT